MDRRDVPLDKDLGRRGFLGAAGAATVGAVLGVGGFASADAQASSLGGSTRPVVVTTRSGRVRGVERGDGVLVWKGMPYAASEEGQVAPGRVIGQVTGLGFGGVRSTGGGQRSR